MNFSRGNMLSHHHTHRERLFILPLRLLSHSSRGHFEKQKLSRRKTFSYSATGARRSSNGEIHRNRVLIVGGGPTGLFLAQLLRSYNVQFRLIEAQTPEQRFKHPQAHFLNTRTMEILKHGIPHHKNCNTSHPKSVYERLRNAMPPVEEWESFRFGPDMSCCSESGNILAEVVHPVDRPIVSKVDANGRLVEKLESQKVKEAGKDPLNHIALSPESVGHLAQQKFCRILYDELTTDAKAKNNDVMESDILYGSRVIGFDWNEETSLWSIKTDQGESFDDIDIILAADGAASTVRKSLFSGNDAKSCSNDSTMLGTPDLQRLINVHFEIPHEIAVDTDLASNANSRIPPAMLYTVFNPDVLAMVVRHGPGEYVLQVPYFEPYQKPEDFSIQKVRKIIRSLVGNTCAFIIHSVRPWTMGSLVARNYYTDPGLILVGDAAHVFPPAGGFGMNTGLQDAYSLAWRIALNRQQEQRKKVLQQSLSVSTIGHVYERERQPVARRNASLSVRNYQRVLNVMRACYLDDRHPSLLIRALDASASFIPLEMRRRTFLALLQSALSPLSQLKTAPNGIYARTVKANLRELLGAGQGLPLLFPGHELDFSYAESSREDADGIEEDDWSEDSMASSPCLVLGRLFPHVEASISLETLRKFPRLQPIKNGDDDFFNISTRDLAAQLATDETPCVFCLLEIRNSTIETKSESRVNNTLLTLRTTLQETFDVPFVMSRLIISRKHDGDEIQFDRSNLEGSANICELYVDIRQWQALNLFSVSRGMLTTSDQVFVAIRPDGHVAAISSKGNHSNKLIPGIQTTLFGIGRAEEIV